MNEILKAIAADTNVSAEFRAALPVGHTPGPWHWFHTPHSSNQEYVVKVGRFHVASVDFVGNSVTERANAKLIAAAPELLDALQMLYAETADYIRLNNLGGIDNQCMKLARAAIAKATT